MDDLAIDVGKREEGDWVDNIPGMGPLRLRTRGVNNKQWRQMSARLFGALPRSKQNDPDEADRIIAILLRECALLDWEGLDKPDGTPLPFSKEQAQEYLTNPKYDRKFLNAALHAATVVGEQNQGAVQETAKN